MLAKWREGYEVVYMVPRRQSDGGLADRMGRRIFHHAVRLAADLRLPPEAGDFRLLEPGGRGGHPRLPERTRFMMGIYHWVGFRETGLAL